MAKLQGPLFSEKASKQLGKNLIYKTKGGKSFLTKYNKPGGVKPFTPSASQVAKRAEYSALVEKWRGLFPVERNYWNNLATKLNQKMSGWNYFLKKGGTPFIAKNGLVGYWSFDEIVAGKIPDLSGEENHGTPRPLYPDNYPHLVNSKNAKMVKAGSFDGIDDFVACGDDESLNPVNLTVEAWIYPKAEPVSIFSAIANKKSSYILDRYSTKKIRFYLYGLTVKAHFSASDILLNQWTHVVGTWDGSRVKIYLNGVLDKDEGDTGTIDTGTDLLIGSFIGTGKFFDGWIDEVRVYNRALLLPEIKKHYDLLF